MTNTVKSVIALLSLSDTVADRLELKRYLDGGGKARSEISIPSDINLDQHAKSVSFSISDLESIGIDVNLLQPFELSETGRNALSNEQLFGSSLEAQPLVRYKDKIILAAPSSVCRACIKLILDRVTTKMGPMADFFMVKRMPKFLLTMS